MAVKNYAWASVDAVAHTLFQLVALVVLTKFLSADDYGVWGMMAIFIALGNILVDSGLGGALVKDKNPSKTDYNTLFCFNMVVAIVFYAILFACGGLIASFYHTPELASYIRVYGLVLIISAFGIVQTTQLVKGLRFKEMAIIAIVANVLGVGAAVIMAVMGFKVWCLVAQQLVTMSTRVVLSFLCCRYMPRIEFSKQSLKKQFGFGGSILLSNIVTTIYTNIVSSIIPKIGTTAQNGYYLQASKIQGVPQTVTTTVVDKVVFPELSKLPEGEMLPAARKIVRKIFLLTSICFLLCICFSKLIVWIVLGNNWMDTVVYLKILFFVGYGAIYMFLARSLYKAQGKTSLILKTALIKSLVGLAVIGLSTIWGVWGIVYGAVAASVINAIISAFFLKKYLGYSILQQLYDVKWGFLCVALSVVAVVFIV